MRHNIDVQECYDHTFHSIVLKMNYDVYSITLFFVLQVLNGIADQDTFYDITDYLEEQGMEAIIERHMTKNSADLDLVSQLNVYEAALRCEDGDSTGDVSDVR